MDACKDDLLNSSLDRRLSAVAISLAVYSGTIVITYPDFIHAYIYNNIPWQQIPQDPLARSTPDPLEDFDCL